jgi:glycerate 2-kinase
VEVYVVAAVDHFGPGTTAAEVALAVSVGVHGAGATCRSIPLSDGGPGFLAVFGGPSRHSLVMGPLGDPVNAPWRLQGTTAVVEAAVASGPDLVGGPDGNDAIAAGTHGTGELILAAAEAGAKRIIVGTGGTASTDGGLGAIRAIFPTSRLRGVRLIVACDVAADFRGAANGAEAKGASPAQVKLLRRRLDRLVQVYREQYGVDIGTLEGAGAGGGLAGGLAAVGGELHTGFAVVADYTDLSTHIEAADLVITGERFLDQHSLQHGVVGGVLDLAERVGTRCLAIATEVFDAVEHRVPVLLVDKLDPRASIAEAVQRHLST